MNPLSSQNYCITVREKAGEVGALAALTPGIAAGVLAHIVARPKPEKQTDSELVKERVGNILRAVGRSPCVWDSRFLFFDRINRDADAAHLGFLLSQIRGFSANAIPAIHRGFDFFRKKTLVSHARLSNLPVCLIVPFSAFGDWETVLSDVADMGITPEKCILKLDTSDADLSQHHEFSEFLRDQIISLTDLAPWSRLIVSGTSYPLKNKAPKNGQFRVVRNEWLVWRELKQIIDVKGLGVIFGDFGADHAKIDYKPGGRTVQHLRWGLENETVIVRGDSEFNSIHDVAKRVIELFSEHDSYFSQGDAFVRSCAKRISPGNATTWRTANMNRHITMMVLETSKLIGMPIENFRIEREVQLELFVTTVS